MLLVGVAVWKVFAKLQLATKNDEVLAQSTSAGNTLVKSASVSQILNLESRNSFRVVPVFDIS